MRRTIKRLSALLICMSGVPLLMVAGTTSDPVIRALTITAGTCLIISGGMQCWLLRRHKRKSWDDQPY